ncbi:MAG: hypothetical protein HY735_38025 [Verrucomicrobia bacterium]|nr:hypothetical protein [Verrucomicrobiota bacterium]
MTRADILREIQALPAPERFEILESLARLLRPPGPARPLAGTTERSLASAAEALRADYQTDPDLTDFTALDGEDFHATG